MVGFARERKEPQVGPDYSVITSRDSALALVRKGELYALYLLPLEFGGTDLPENTVYVPRSTVEMKQSLDRNVIRPLIVSGTITRYAATPRYTGRSFVPIAIEVVASDPGNFTTTLNIWGDASPAVEDA